MVEHLPSMCVALGSIPSTEEQTVLIFLFAMVFPHNVSTTHSLGESPWGPWEKLFSH